MRAGGLGGGTTMQVWNHFPGYHEARQRVLLQDTEADLRLLDDLFGRDALEGEGDAEAVKAEALRQLEIEWREGRNETAELFVALHRSRPPASAMPNER